MSDVGKYASGPDAAVVIVNYQTPALVARCLELVARSCPELELETVIVDNGSDDGSVERLRNEAPEANVIAMESNCGFAAGVNTGFRHTVADLVVLLNPDTEVRENAIQSLLERLREHPHTGVVAPLLESPDGQLAPNGYRRFPNLLTVSVGFCVPLTYVLSYVPALHPDAMSPAALLAGRDPAHVTGAALAIRREAFDAAGPFDEGFFLYLEETEWQRRVAGSGWGIEIVPHARVCHLVRGGGDGALAPSPYSVGSSLRYLRMRGVPTIISRIVIAAALVSSLATLRLIWCIPSKRVKAAAQISAYRSLLRELL